MYSATMRIDLEYTTLNSSGDAVPDFNALVALQTHRWVWRVPYNPQLPTNSTGEYISGTREYVRNYPLTGGKRWRNINTGVPLDRFLSDLEGVDLTYKPATRDTKVSILDAVLGAGLSFVPVVGPLLALPEPLVFQAIEDPGSLEVEKLLTAEYGIKLAKALIKSAQKYKSYTKATVHHAAFVERPRLHDHEKPKPL